jgi:transcriptional regulator of acetoin/glycerol metabolism
VALVAVNTRDVNERVLRQLRATCERHNSEVRNLITRCVDEGARSNDIAEAMGISRATLWRRYGDELQRGGDRPGVDSG